MAINTTQVGNTNTTVYASTNDSAVTMVSFCNYSASAANLTIYIVPNAGAAGNGNIIIKELSIAAGDTYMLYSGGEKLLLEDGDSIVALASVASAISSVVSYTGI